MAYKVFTAGSLATASDVNLYLMNQTVATFSTASARNSAITSPVEGQLAYINTNDALTYYDGTAWRNFMFPAAWIAYTPTLTNVTLGSGGTSAFYYQVVGKTINVRGRITLGTTGTLTGAATFSLPVNAVLDQQFWNCDGAMTDTSASAFYPSLIRVYTASAQLNALNASGTYVSHTLTSATVPFTWTSGDIINVGFSYEGV
jgi:hypothetical protein